MVADHYRSIGVSMLKGYRTPIKANERRARANPGRADLQLKSHRRVYALLIRDAPESEVDHSHAVDVEWG